MDDNTTPSGTDVAAQDISLFGETQETQDQPDNGMGQSLLNREEWSEDAPDRTDRDSDDDGWETGVPETPEAYRIAFGKDVSVDTELLAGFKDVAHSMGLAHGQAQELADFYVAHAAASSKAYQNAQIAALKEARKGWEATITARPEFRQELVEVKRTMKEFGSQELVGIMDQTLLGSHPVFFDFVVKIGKALAEPQIRGNAAGGRDEIPLIDRLWPDK